MTSLERLVAELSKLPGIGAKTALRLVLHILRQPPEYPRALSKALTDVSDQISFCSRCFHITDTQPCRICRDAQRDTNLVCVVEDSADLMAIEKSAAYRGMFHVLQGALSPLDGIGPERLRIEELLQRIKLDGMTEVILATNPNVTGDATALYLSKILKPTGVKITKLASGIPVGTDIQYVDSLTLSRALSSRTEY